MKRHIISFILAVFFISLPASAFAYNYTFSCGARWTNLPVSYWINSAGSGDVSFGQVETIIQDSFDVWGDPCCSRFAGEYQGTTQLTAINNQGRVVFSWEESQWNPQWGSVNQTIGITFSQVYNNCTVAEAPILFNGIGFRFSTDNSGTDLQSIATHEIGHLLGLGHSPIQQATMYAAYVGGTGARTLHQDDIDGVCSLYNRPCTCFSDSECASGEQCVNQSCEEVPCQRDNECEAGLVCRNGDCVIPPCGSDADCSAGFVCQNQICVSNCPVCRTNCTTNADCGANGFCVDDQDGGKLCLVLCGGNSECPGDSVCYRVPDGQGGEAFVCGAPNASSSLCPDGYTCELDDIVDQCQADNDCSVGEVCRNTVDGLRCVEAASACDGVNCPEGSTCVDGECLDNSSNNTSGNNNGGNNNGTGSNNVGGGNNNNGSGSSGQDDPVIVIFPEQPDDRTCSTAPAGSVPGSLLLLGLFAFARRRRRG